MPVPVDPNVYDVQHVGPYFTIAVRKHDKWWVVLDNTGQEVEAFVSKGAANVCCRMLEGRRNHASPFGS